MRSATRALQFGIESFDRSSGKLALRQIGADADDVRFAIQGHPTANHQEGRTGSPPLRRSMTSADASPEIKAVSRRCHQCFPFRNQALGIGQQEHVIRQAGQFADEAVPQSRRPFWSKRKNGAGRLSMSPREKSRRTLSCSSASLRAVMFRQWSRRFARPALLIAMGQTAGQNPVDLCCPCRQCGIPDSKCSVSPQVGDKVGR